MKDKLSFCTIVATMNRSNYGFLDEMNVRGQVVVINQTNENRMEIRKKDQYDALIFSSNKRGLSRSRNLGVSCSDSDIFLIADDDIQYFEGYHEIITRQFMKHPEADIIAFNIERQNMSPNRIGGKKHGSWRRSPRHKYYISTSLAFRRSSYEWANLSFHPRYGAGSYYKNGEESLVVRDARLKGLRVFETEESIGKQDFYSSTWFDGYDEKYLFDKGALLKTLYPKAWCFMMPYFFKLKKKSKLTYGQMLKQMIKGARSVWKRN